MDWVAGSWSGTEPVAVVVPGVCARPWVAEGAFVRAYVCSNFFSFCKILQKIWRARSRLYQNEILQGSMRLTAFFKLYKMCTLLHRSKLNILAKNRFEKSAICVKIMQKIANFAKFWLTFHENC